MSTNFTYKIAMDDGAAFEVVADQRDIAAFEREPFGCSFFAMASRPYTFYRWTAWHAAKRAGSTKLDWEGFDARCMEVDDITPQPAKDDDSGDPGHPAASAGT